MWVCACLYVRAYVCVLRMRKPKFLAYGILYGTAHFTLAIPIMHCFHVYKRNHTLRLLLKKKKKNTPKNKQTGQSAYTSAASVSRIAVTILAT